MKREKDSMREREREKREPQKLQGKSVVASNLKPDETVGHHFTHTHTPTAAPQVTMCLPIFPFSLTFLFRFYRAAVISGIHGSCCFFVKAKLGD